MTFSIEGVTSKNGSYSLHVEGDHEEEICDVKAIQSSRPDCSERIENYGTIVALTKNCGVSSIVRYANPLGFMKKKPLPNCIQVLIEMGFFPSD